MNGFDHTRVGIYGGTFAPVHNGHVRAAKYGSGSGSSESHSGS